jgi:sirohydrochlorin cobaltochelatase
MTDSALVPAAAPAAAARHPDTTGLLLFAHGARDPQWAQPFEAVARTCRAVRGEHRVALAFLEFMTPDMVAAGTRLAQAGCTAVDVVPLFLGAGGHVRKDIPVLMARLEAEHPGVRWTLRPAVGESATLVAAMADVALAAGSAPEVAVR